MGAWVSSLPAPLSVVPGEETVFSIRVGNTGSLVDQFSVAILGDPARWTAVTPAEIRLLPDTQGEVEIRLQPPRIPSTRAGPTTLGVRVASREDPAGSVIRQAVVDVAAFEQTVSTLTPPIARHRSAADYTLTVSNQGNQAITAVYGAQDPEGILSFTAAPLSLAVDPGGRGEATIRATGPPLLVGRPRRLPFRVGVRTNVSAPSSPPSIVEATLVQTPLLPWWLVPVAVVLVLLLTLVLASAMDSGGAAVATVTALAVAIAAAVRGVSKRRRGGTTPSHPEPPLPPPPPPTGAT